MDDKIAMMDILSIHTASPFKDLFPIRETVLNEIAEDMKVNGFDTALPIVIWGGHKVTIVDGHTRYAAAVKIGLGKVPVKIRDFASEDDALNYAIKSQRNRRNLSDAELVNCVRELDRKKNAGRYQKLAPSEADLGKSAFSTAKKLGISRTKVEKIRSINKHGTKETKDAIASGKMTINKAYNQTMKERKAENEAKSPEKPPAEIRAERIEAMVKTITEKARRQFEAEVQEFPELRYTLDERNGLDDRLSTAIGKLIEEIIPLETEENNTDEE